MEKWNDGIGLNRLEKTGKGWIRLELAGTGWKRLEYFIIG